MITDSENIPLILNGLFDGLGTKLDSGDTKKITEYLNGGEIRLKNLIEQSQNEKLRDTIKMVLSNASELSDKLTTSKVNRHDVNDFLNGVKERISQRFAERIRKMAQN